MTEDNVRKAILSTASLMPPKEREAFLSELLGPPTDDGQADLFTAGPTTTDLGGV